MLALSRRPGQSIVIGGNILVTVVWVKGDKVRLAFDAPRDVTVNRFEVQQKIDAQKNPDVSPDWENDDWT